MEDRAIYQGDSIEESFTSKGITTFDDSWALSSWAILSALGETPKATGSITVAADNKSLDMEVPCSATEILETGDYILVAQFKRTTGFSKEQHCILTVRQQGIPG